MKKTLLISLIILILVLGIFTMVQGYAIGPINILSYGGLRQKDNALQSKIDQITSLATINFKNETNNIEGSKNKLIKAKKEYEDLITVNPENGEVSRQLEQYEAEYLWTKIGNHAKKEGLKLKIDISKAFEPTVTKDKKTNEQTTEGNSDEENKVQNAINNTTINVTAKDEEDDTDEETEDTNEEEQTTEEQTTDEEQEDSNTKFDLKFAAIGKYVAIADFIYDIENDSTLGFKIEEFNIDSSEDMDAIELIATFTCKDISIANILQTSNDQAKEDLSGRPNPIAGSTATPTTIDASNTTNNTTNNTNSTRRNTTNETNTSNTINTSN